MGNSAFEILILPIFWATLGGLAAGPMILAALSGIDVVVGYLARLASIPSASQALTAPRPKFLAGRGELNDDMPGTVRHPIDVRISGAVPARRPPASEMPDRGIGCRAMIRDDPGYASSPRGAAGAGDSSEDPAHRGPCSRDDGRRSDGVRMPAP